MKELSRNDKLSIVLMGFAFALLFYALGIATNLFGNAVFSFFFILSNEAAHSLSHAIAIVSIALIAGGLSVELITRRQQGKIKLPAIVLGVALILLFYAVGVATGFFGNPIFSVFFVISSDTASYVSFSIAVLSVALMVAGITGELMIRRHRPRTTITYKLAKSSTDKVTCPSCRREYTPKAYLGDVSESGPEQIIYCPYCGTPTYD